MKKLFFLASVLLVGFTSCSGPAGFDGPIGPEGPAGQDGGLVYASAIELIGDFTPTNDFQIVEPFGFDVFPADVALVYIKWDQLDDGTELWRQLPQSAYLKQGILAYNFDFTTADFSLFLDGTVPDFAALDPIYLNNQVFRIVVVPAEFLETGRLGAKTYENVTKAFGIKESDFVKRDLR
jgi:hypothetical protein